MDRLLKIHPFKRVSFTLSSCITYIKMQLRFVDRSVFYFHIPDSLTLSDDLDPVQKKHRIHVAMFADWLPNYIH